MRTSWCLKIRFRTPKTAWYRISPGRSSRSDVSMRAVRLKIVTEICVGPTTQQHSAHSKRREKSLKVSCAKLLVDKHCPALCRPSSAVQKNKSESQGPIDVSSAGKVRHKIGIYSALHFDVGGPGRQYFHLSSALWGVYGEVQDAKTAFSRIVTSGCLYLALNASRIAAGGGLKLMQTATAGQQEVGGTKYPDINLRNLEWWRYPLPSRAVHRTDGFRSVLWFSARPSACCSYGDQPKSQPKTPARVFMRPNTAPSVRWWFSYLQPKSVVDVDGILLDFAVYSEQREGGIPPHPAVTILGLFKKAFQDWWYSESTPSLRSMVSRWFA
ncbi:hypothetical protein C8F04DRAFT_1359590 [Mycena alexandri]|uniref:Uncharacterized protein n=1 Tax=Mycena alexandri TaxID=1745969 RepID=A0AAD6SRZ5_9AGAR|nr:hypothetical protein C8F04DRAFT_1359590 [Mycena alexandri]